MALMEAKIIVPSQIDGRTTAFECGPEIDRIIQKWGGVTITTGGGAWLNEHGKRFVDEVGIITCAMQPNPENDDAWRVIALRLGKLLGQESVYCRLASGAVEFLDPQSAEVHV